MADWVIERLNASHDQEGFSCGEPSLDTLKQCLPIDQAGRGDFHFIRTGQKVTIMEESKKEDRENDHNYHRY